MRRWWFLVLLVHVPVAVAQPPSEPVGTLTLSPDEQTAVPITSTTVFKVRFEWSCSAYELNTGVPQEYAISLKIGPGAKRMDGELERAEFEGQVPAPEHCGDASPQRNISTVLRLRPNYDWPAHQPLNLTVDATFSQWGPRDGRPLYDARFLKHYEANATLTILPAAHAQLFRHDTRPLIVYDNGIPHAWIGNLRYESNEFIDVKAELRQNPKDPPVSITEYGPTSLNPAWTTKPGEAPVRMHLTGSQEKFELKREYPFVVVLTLKDHTTGAILETVEANAAVRNNGTSYSPGLDVAVALLAVGSVLALRRRRP